MIIPFNTYYNLTDTQIQILQLNKKILENKILSDPGFTPYVDGNYFKWNLSILMASDGVHVGVNSPVLAFEYLDFNSNIVNSDLNNFFFELLTLLNHNKPFGYSYFLWYNIKSDLIIIKRNSEHLITF